jgi:membrane-bound ClpP family serine protease
MVDGESQLIPLVGVRLAGSRTIAGALKKAREDKSVKAVVFRIETGGGSSLAADVILREAILTARAKPFIVSMGSTAASGGYYAAVAGHPIFANRSTVTGSWHLLARSTAARSLARRARRSAPRPPTRSSSGRSRTTSEVPASR